MERNVTYITIGGYVEVEKYRLLYFFALSLVYIVIICSNATIVCLILRHPNLHEPMYIFIAALLCNSVLFCTVVYPKMIIDVLSETQVITYSVCVLQCFFYYSLMCSDFLLLAAMAYDRYVSICKPLQYPIIMTKSKVRLFLVLAWIVPSAHISVACILVADIKLCNFNFKGIYCNNLINKLHCAMSRILAVYGVFVLLNVTILPLLFIAFTYTKIFIITYKSCKEVKKKAVETCLPHLVVLINFTCLVTFEIIIVRLNFDISNTVHLIISLQLVMYHPLFNPIVYGVKMKEISKHLKKLFCKHNTH